MSETTNSRLTPSGLPGRRSRISAEKPKNSGAAILRISVYLGNQKWLMSLLISLLLINTAATLLGSYLLRPIINTYIIPHNIAGLIKMVDLLSIIYIIGSLAAIWQNRLMIKVAQRTINNIRIDLFSKIQSLPLHFFDTTSHGELMSRFSNDVDNISDSLNTSVTQILTSALTLPRSSLKRVKIILPRNRLPWEL